MSKNTTPAPATPAPALTYREVTGTRQAPKTAYRALRQEKGYGRVALAAALGITTSALWKIENHSEGAELKAAMAALRALPSLKKVAPAPAKKAAAAPKAAKASSTDLI